MRGQGHDKGRDPELNGEALLGVLLNSANLGLVLQALLEGFRKV
jgi:hypothetical protein